MKRLFVLIVAFFLSLNFAFAADTRMHCDTLTLEDLSGVDVSSETPVTISTDSADYLYAPASTQRSGAFSCQLMVTSTAPVDLSIQAQVALQDTGTFANAWGPGDNGSNSVTITTTGAVEDEILNPKRLPVTIPGKKMRLKVSNNGTVPLTVSGAILASW